MPRLSKRVRLTFLLLILPALFPLFHLLRSLLEFGSFSDPVLYAGGTVLLVAGTAVVGAALVWLAELFFPKYALSAATLGVLLTWIVYAFLPFSVLRCAVDPVCRQQLPPLREARYRATLKKSGCESASSANLPSDPAEWPFTLGYHWFSLGQWRLTGPDHQEYRGTYNGMDGAINLFSPDGRAVQVGLYRAGALAIYMPLGWGHGCHYRGPASRD